MELAATISAWLSGLAGPHSAIIHKVQAHRAIFTFRLCREAPNVVGYVPSGRKTLVFSPPSCLPRVIPFVRS